MRPLEQTDLRNRILEEMTVNRAAVLEQAFDLAKRFVRLEMDGTVDILQQDGLVGKDLILLYLIGKRYAREAALAPTCEVANTELLEHLGVPEGSLYPWLKDLRDSGRIRQTRRGRRVCHSIPLSLVKTTLLELERRLAQAPGEAMPRVLSSC